jgi:hypothetical protein
MSAITETIKPKNSNSKEATDKPGAPVDVVNIHTTPLNLALNIIPIGGVGLATPAEVSNYADKYFQVL